MPPIAMVVPPVAVLPLAVVEPSVAVVIVSPVAFSVAFAARWRGAMVC